MINSPLRRHWKKATFAASAAAVWFAGSSLSQALLNQPITEYEDVKHSELAEGLNDTAIRSRVEKAIIGKDYVYLILNDEENYEVRANLTNREETESMLADLNIPYVLDEEYAQPKSFAELISDNSDKLPHFAMLLLGLYGVRKTRGAILHEAKARWRSFKKPKDDWRTCLHKAGHALEAYKQGRLNDKSYVTKHGNDMNENPHFEDGDFDTELTKETILERLRLFYAGMAAELVVLENHTVGVSTDVHNNTYLLSEVYVNSGMSDTLPALGPLNIAYNHGFPFSEKTRRELDEEIITLAESCKQDAIETMTVYKPSLIRLAEELQRRNFLGGRDIRSIIEQTVDPALIAGLTHS